MCFSSLFFVLRVEMRTFATVLLPKFRFRVGQREGTYI